MNDIYDSTEEVSKEEEEEELSKVNEQEKYFIP